MADTLPSFCGSVWKKNLIPNELRAKADQCTRPLVFLLVDDLFLMIDGFLMDGLEHP